MSDFDVSEIYQFAIRIEENGEKFYKYAANLSKTDEAKKMFNYLANEEVKHKETFERFLSKIEKYEPSESYPDEYFFYIRSYADNIVFDQKKLDQEMHKVKDILSAIDFGIKREQESILYYQEIKNLIPKSQHEQLEKILNEERKHFLKLWRFRRTITKGA